MKQTANCTSRISKLYILLFLISFFNPMYSQQKSFQSTITGAGNPVIFIPGYASTGEIWDETILEFDKNEFECHVLSLAGFGGVDGIITDNYLRDVARDLNLYIESHQLREPSIIGHSLGGLVALLVGIEGGTQIDKIICVDSWPFTPAAIDPNTTVEDQRGVAESYFKYDSIPLGQKYSQSGSEVRPYIEILTRCDDKVDLLVETTLNSEDRICKQAMYELFTIDARKRLGEISAEVLILGTWFAYKDYGVSQESMTEAFKNQYYNLPDKEIFVHSDARHFLMWDAPDWFLYHVFNFLKD